MSDNRKVQYKLHVRNNGLIGRINQILQSWPLLVAIGHTGHTGRTSTSTSTGSNDRRFRNVEMGPHKMERSRPHFVTRHQERICIDHHIVVTVDGLNPTHVRLVGGLHDGQRHAPGIGFTALDRQLLESHGRNSDPEQQDTPHEDFHVLSEPFCDQRHDE